MIKNQTPNQALIDAYGVSTTLVARRLLRTFDAATPAEVEQGTKWYGEAGTHARVVGEVAGRSTEHGAGVLAALSPRCRWDRNIAQAYAVVTGSKVPGPILKKNITRAHNVLASDDPLTGLGNGPKVRAFYANILGDVEAVTIDTWAVRAALGTADVPEKLGRKGVYDALANAYRVAAAKRGVSPSTMQAVVWVVVRNHARELLK